jgi:hypothetical protein
MRQVALRNTDFTEPTLGSSGGLPTWWPLTAGPDAIVHPGVDLPLAPTYGASFGQPNALREVTGLFEAPDRGVG